MSNHIIDAEAEYTPAIERIARTYGPRALALLTRIAREVHNAGYTIVTEPYDMSADDYRWSLLISRDPLNSDNTDDQIDISIEIAEQREYDGEGYGVNFGLDMVEYGGRILGGLTPYNYTNDVWVDSRDDAAVEDRWSILENADISGIPNLLDRG